MNFLSKLGHKNHTPFQLCQMRFETSHTNLPKINTNPELTKAVNTTSQPIFNEKKTTAEKIRDQSYDSLFIFKS